MTTPKRNPSHDVVAALLVEHRHMARLLAVLEEQLGAASRGVAIDREAVRSVMHYMTEFPDAYHHPREDAMFVRLAKRDPALRKGIAAIERAHRTLGAAGKELLAAAQRAPGRRADESGLAARIRDYVGDDRRDVDAGRAAAMATVVATWGYLGAGDAPDAWGADHLIAHPDELPALIGDRPAQGSQGV